MPYLQFLILVPLTSCLLNNYLKCSPNTHDSAGAAHASALGQCYEFRAVAARCGRGHDGGFLLTRPRRAAWGPPPPVLASKQQQANKLKASKIKRLQKRKKSSGGIRRRSEVTGTPARSAAMSPRSALQTQGSECCVFRWGRSVEEAGLLTGFPGNPTLHP